MIQAVSLILFIEIGLVLGLNQPEVTINQGILKGLYTRTVENREISSFLGIPYAKPVIGKNRFQEADAAGSWLGLYNATRSPPECLQLDHFFFNTPYAVHGVEDCLYLNVFTPKIPTQKEAELLDVIAFIPGGAFMFYSSAPFEPTLLLDRDIVLVTLNYRVGPLGFISTGDNIVSGNNGLKDQVLALKWIQDNIAAFGGNPKSVTLAGLSAGAASVDYHLLSPLSKGLFHRAIMMSGTALNPWTQAENVQEKTKYIANELGCPTADSLPMIECLRDRPAKHIVNLSRHFLKWLYNPFSPFGPVVEKNCEKCFICEQPLHALRKGRAMDIPILASFAAQEGLYPAAEIVRKENLEQLKLNWNDLIPHILDFNYTVPSEKRLHIGDEIKEEYKINLNTDEGIKKFIELVGERLYINDIIKAVKSHASLNKSPVYLYRFSYRGKNSGTSLFIDGDYGVSHGDDSSYIFHYKMVSSQETVQDKQMSKKMVDLWVSFASNGTLQEPWTPLSNHTPSVPFVDIEGPDAFLPSIYNNPREKFWRKLGLHENIEHEYCTSDQCTV